MNFRWFRVLAALAFGLVSRAEAQYAATVSATPSNYSANGGTVVFNVALSYPAGVSPTISVKPSSADWAYAGANPVTGLSVDSVSLVSGGVGYTSAPVVTISGGGGSGATATATISGGQVASIALTNKGSGYTSTPSVSMSGGGATTSATAVASIPNFFFFNLVKIGDKTDPKAADSDFGFVIDSSVAELATSAAFTFTLSYPAGLTGDQSFDVNAYYRLNNVAYTLFTKTLKLSVGVPTLSGSSTANGTVGVSFSYPLSATGSPTSYAIASGALPAGVTLNTTTGLISGTPLAAGTYNVTLTATNGTGISTPFSLAITIAAPPTAPAIVVQPRSQAFATGSSLVLYVTAAGSTPFSYQWRKDGIALVDGGRIAGATTGTLVISSAQSSDAGAYSVVVSNGIAPNATSGVATVSIAEAGFAATQAVLGPGYVPGSPITVTNTISYPGSLNALLWTALIPSGWGFVSSVDAGIPTVYPSAGEQDTLSWVWQNPPASGSTFTYTLTPDANSLGSKTITSLVEYTAVDTPIQLLATPEPLKIDQITYHTADTNKNFKIDPSELARVIVLYNTRFDTGSGKSRTGAYKIQSGTVDGFAPDSSRDNATVVSLPAYHSADTNRNGKIDPTELSRLIVLYNTRYDTGSGKSRTGAYKAAVGSTTVDGYSPDTSRYP